MTSSGVTLRRIGHIEIRVRELKESAAFYRELLGFQQTEASPPSPNVCICRAHSRDDCSFGLVLVEGLPPSVELAGLDHFSLEVVTKGEVDSLYAKACELGVRATRPRFFDGHYQTFVFDPTGYKVEIAARSDGEGYE